VLIVDGGADWMSAVQMVTAKYPWMCGVHCVAHCGSLALKDLFRIPEVKNIYNKYFISPYILRSFIIDLELKNKLLDN